jgi:hypothetical protein
MKEIIIVLLSFILILWFQNIEDYKYKKNRYTLYEKYKYPIFVSAIIALILSSCSFFTHNTFIKILPNIEKNPLINKIKSNILDQQIFIDPSPF